MKLKTCLSLVEFGSKGDHCAMQLVSHDTRLVKTKFVDNHYFAVCQSTVKQLIFG